MTSNSSRLYSADFGALGGSPWLARAGWAATSARLSLGIALLIARSTARYPLWPDRIWFDFNQNKLPLAFSIRSLL